MANSASIPAIAVDEKSEFNPQGPAVGSMPTRAYARGGSSLAAPSPGLVPIQQVVREGGGLVEIDSREARLRRMRRSVLTTARLMTEQLQGGGFRWKAAMVTTTYRDDVEWEPRHISRMLAALQAYAMRAFGRRLPYEWVGELTKRGRLHYHLIVWLPKGRCLPKPDKRGWWPHGSTRIEWVRSAIGYVSKYASKGDAGFGFPKGARISGWGGLEVALRQVRSWWMLPSWLRGVCTHDEGFRRAPGGGWYSPATGEHIASPFVLVGISRTGARIQQVGPIPEPWLCPFR